MYTIPRNDFSWTTSLETGHFFDKKIPIHYWVYLFEVNTYEVHFNFVGTEFHKDSEYITIVLVFM